MSVNADRRYLFARSDSYLFSYDVNMCMTQTGTGWGLALKPDNSDEPDPSACNVFHVRSESVVGDRDALWGQVRWLTGRCEFKSYGDTASTSGKMLIQSREGAMIDTFFYGSNRLQELGQRRLIIEPHLVDGIDVRVSYWLRFDSAHPKYRWLAQTPCVGFGRAAITGGVRDHGETLFDVPLQMDVYALS